MSSKQWFSALLFAGIVCSFAFSQAKAPAPAEKPSVTPSDFSKEAYVIEKSYTRIRAENDGTGTREVTVEVKVLADAGVKAFAVLNFTYTSANEVVDIDYVRVRKPDGTVVKTPDYNIQDMPGEVTRSAPLYSDLHEKHVAVKGLGVGDVLEYLVRSRVTKPEVPGQFWNEYSFFKTAIAKDERFEISFPSGKYVKIVSPDFKPEIAEEDGQKIYRWTHSNLIMKLKEPGELPRRIPPKPDIQITTFRNWEEVGRWYGDLQKEPVQVTPAIQKKADELTKGLKTDDEKIRATYDFVALKYHYIGLDFGIGRYQPHAAEDVLDNGYGDCKDKHTLMASLLKAEGIEAWPALIHASRKLDPDVPSPAQFNHVITVVPRGDKFVWLDTTPEVAPYELLILLLRGKQALVIPAGKPPLLMSTPENAPFRQRQSMSMEGKLSGEGTFTGHSQQSYHGDSEVILRSVFRQVSQSQWKEAVQRFSYGLNFGGDVSNVNMTQPDDLNKPFELSYDYERKNYSDWEHNQITPPIPPLGVEMAKDAKKPQEPVVLGGLGEIEYDAQLTLPAGYSVTSVPQNVDLVRSFAEYHSAYDVEKGVFSAKRRLLIKKPEVELSSWEDLRDFGKAVSDDENRYVLLTLERKTLSDPGKTAASGKEKGDVLGHGTKADARIDDVFAEGTRALQGRDFQRAQEMFEKVIALDPNYKGAHFNLAIALASRRDIPDAMNELRKEEKVSPADSRAYQVLATYLTQTGRRDEAIPEWRRLLSVDPGNRTAASTLGGLLYQAEKYSEAVQVLEAAVNTAPESSALQFQLGEAYIKTGQKEKAIASLRHATELKADDAMTLNNVAFTLADNDLNLDLAQEYGEKALSKLHQQAQEAQGSADAGMRVTFDLSLLWDTLGWIYFKQADLKRAEGMIRAAWLLGELSDVAEHLGEVYEKEGKSQQAAHAYEWALTVSSIPTFSVGPSDAMNMERTRTSAIKERYKKLTGKEPGLTEIRRLPNGQWTKTPAERLRATREVKVSNEGKVSGSAEFTVVFKPGKVQSAEFSSGDRELQKLSDKLAAAHYPLEFPPDSNAILVLHVGVKCNGTAECIGTLVNPTPDPRRFADASN